MHYKQITIEERDEIQKMLWEKASIRTIAKKLCRSPSSITRELKRNQSKEMHLYRSRIAQERTDEYKTHRGREKRLKNEEIRKYVIEKLKEGWSPEQISGRIQIDNPGTTISHEAIYQFVYAQVFRNGWGNVKPEHEDLRIYLRRRRKRRIHKGTRRCQRVHRPKGRSITERPEIVNDRKRIGDWEGDSVESKDHKPGINTLVERKIGYLIITKLKAKTSKATVEAVTSKFSKVDEKLKKTITVDNGPENQDWESIENETGMLCYFANPYHSWERGTNENTNGLIREYFPKKTDFTIIPDEEIQFVQDLLNNRPRKRLGYIKPSELWSVALES
jgi:IS30 family transposase